MVQGGVAALTELDWRRVGTAVVALSLPSTALAQRTYGDDPAFETALGVLGAVTRGFHIDGVLGTTYDSDLDHSFRSGPVVTPGQSGGQGGFRLAPAVTAGVAYPLGRQLVSFDATYGRDFYIGNSLRNRTRYAFTGGLNWQLGARCNGTVNADFRRRQNILSDVAVQIDNVQATQTYGFNASCKLGSRFGVGGGVSHNETDNKNALRQAFDARTTSYSLNLNYGSPLLGTLSVGGSYDNSDYPRRFQPVAVDATTGLFVLSNSADSVEVFRGTIGYTRPIGSRLTFNISGSYLDAKPKPVSVLTPATDPLTGLPLLDARGRPILNLQDRAGFKGGGYDASLSYQPTSRLNASVSASKQISSSSNVGALFVVNQRYGVDLGYNLGPSITTGIGATFNKRQYKNSFASITEPVARRNEDTTRYYVRAGYAPSRRLFDVDVEVGHQKRKSNPALYTNSNTTATVTLRVRFGRGL